MKLGLVLLFVFIASISYGAPVYESLTVADTSVGFASVATGTNRTVCHLETAQIRYRDDGTAPTSSEGHLVEIGKQVTVTDRAIITKIRFIRTGTTSGVLKCTHYDN